MKELDPLLKYLPPEILRAAKLVTPFAEAGRALSRRLMTRKFPPIPEHMLRPPPGTGVTPVSSNAGESADNRHPSGAVDVLDAHGRVVPWRNR